MNSGIHYGGFIDWITFYALSAIFHPYNGGMFQAMIVIICRNKVGFKQAVAGNSVKRTFQFAFCSIKFHFAKKYTY